MWDGEEWWCEGEGDGDGEGRCEWGLNSDKVSRSEPKSQVLINYFCIYIFYNNI